MAQASFSWMQSASSTWVPGGTTALSNQGIVFTGKVLFSREAVYGFSSNLRGRERVVEWSHLCLAPQRRCNSCLQLGWGMWGLWAGVVGQRVSLRGEGELGLLP